MPIKVYISGVPLADLCDPSCLWAAGWGGIRKGLEEEEEEEEEEEAEAREGGC